MAKVNPWKMGIGSGSIFLGIYILFNQTATSEIVFGIIAIAFGIGIIASN